MDENLRANGCLEAHDIPEICDMPDRHRLPATSLALNCFHTCLPGNAFPRATHRSQVDCVTLCMCLSCARAQHA